MAATKKTQTKLQTKKEVKKRIGEAKKEVKKIFAMNPTEARESLLLSLSSQNKYLSKRPATKKRKDQSKLEIVFEHFDEVNNYVKEHL